MFCGMQSTQMPALCDLYMSLHTFVVRMETEKATLKHSQYSYTLSE